jgi:hypothetical protein
MKNALTVLACFGMLLAFGAPAHADEYAYRRALDRTVPAPGASTLIFTGYNGDVHFIGDGTGSVRVHAVLKARSADAVNALDVSVSRQGSAVLVQDVCPSQRRLVFWTFADCDIELEIHYPRAMALTLKSQNGDIQVDGPAAAVSIANGNGDVHISDAAGNVRISQSNGDITTRLAKNWRGSTIALHTNQGDVSLFVPSDFGASYTTHVLLGSVENQAPRKSGSATVTATVRFGDIEIKPE